MEKRKKNERGLSEAEIAKLSPAAREQLRAEGVLPKARDWSYRSGGPKKAEKKSEDPKRKFYLVSYFSPERGKRLEFLRPIEAKSIADAKQQGRALITNERGIKDVVARQVNPKTMKRTKKKISCSNCGGTHHADYCNARDGSRKGAPAKKEENFFGLGKQAKKKRAAKARVRKAKRTFKADKLEAKARLLRAINPKGQKAEDRKQKAEKIVNQKSKIKNSIWTTAYRDQLPDSAFAYIEPGGHKDQSRRTVPRRLRRFPIRDHNGNLDAAHVRNALARLPQSSLSRAQEAKAGRVIFAAARELAIGNPKLLGSLVDAVTTARGKVKRNPDLLDVFAKGTAGLLNAIQIGRHLARRPRKRKKTTRTAQQREGNPNTKELRKLYEDFHGEANCGEVLNMIALEGSPDDAAQLGPLHAIKLANGRVQTFPVKLGPVVKYRNSIGWSDVRDPFAVLGGAQHGRSLRRAYIGQQSPVEVPARLQNGGVVNYGDIAEVEYYARKPHLYGEDSPWFLFYHKLGEEGGARPELIMRNGVFGLSGGDYKIQKEGIRD